MPAVPPSGSAPAIQELIERYHALLAGPVGEASIRMLADELRESRLHFGDRPICTVLRPHFLTAAEAAHLREEVETLMLAFRKLWRAVRELPELRAVLGLTAEEDAILDADRQGIEPDAIGRIDGFFVRDGGFRVIEYNAESPGGIAFGDELCRIFRGLPILRALEDAWDFENAPVLDLTYEQLLLAHRARTGVEGTTRPSIAVVDWPSAPTRREFELCVEHFRRRGSPARVVDPSELRYENGRLHAGDFLIDVVYKRVLVKDLLAHGGLSHPLVRAVADGAVACASGFGVHVLYRKDLFALLWDERLRQIFAPPEWEAIARTVPWTHFVADVEIDRDGARRPLLELARERQSQLVLKPTADYGGSGVVLGWLVDGATWDRALKEALERPSVLQERVDVPREPFPVLRDGRPALEPYYLDLNPYIWGGRCSEGFGCRLASGELLNVTAGGGSAVPVFLAEPKGD